MQKREIASFVSVLLISSNLSLYPPSHPSWIIDQRSPGMVSTTTGTVTYSSALRLKVRTVVMGGVLIFCHYFI